MPGDGDRERRLAGAAGHQIADAQHGDRGPPGMRRPGTQGRAGGPQRGQWRQGDRESAIIKSGAERKRVEIIAKSNAEAQRIRGEGESTAAGIYAAAYSRNPEFYSFYRSLQAYRTALGREGDVMVISPDSEFFRYLKSPAPQRR